MPIDKDNTEAIEIECSVVAETEKAILIDDGGTKVWLPRSLIDIDNHGKSATVMLPEWLAKKHGLI